MSQLNIQNSTSVDISENGFYFTTSNDKNNEYQNENQASIISNICNSTPCTNQIKTPSPSSNNNINETQINSCHKSHLHQYHQQGAHKITRMFILLKLLFLSLLFKKMQS